MSQRSAILAVAMAMALLVASCSASSGSQGQTTDPPNPPAPQVPELELPRYNTDGLRLAIGPTEPIFLYNVYVGADEEEAIESLVAQWPTDLLGYFGIQLIYPSHTMLDPQDRAPVLDRVATVTDRLQVPLLVQTAAFLGRTGPSDQEMAAAFEQHESLTGVAIAELSAFPLTAVGGLDDGQRDLLASQLELAVDHDAIFLWADMGYLGPQVFMDAGADNALSDLFSDNAANVVIQVKQNGVGRRFGSMSAAFGMYASGMADNWGINSEDWLWWEASLERLGDPQVEGDFTADGAARSEYPTRARLTYPESLFGTEMLVTAAGGATVFSIEAPNRGTIDLEVDQISAAGENVVFPVLRRLIADRLIPDRDTVLERNPIVYRPADSEQPEMAYDQSFAGLYGPRVCATDDLLSCSQRQWLPYSGKYGLIATWPLNSPDPSSGRVVTSLDGTDDDRLKAVGAPLPDAATGSAWAAPAAGTDRWFVANPNENSVESVDFGLAPFADSAMVSGELPAHGFAIIEGSEDDLRIFIDNFRLDSDQLWDDNIAEEDVTNAYQSLEPASSELTELVIQYPKATTEPVVGFDDANDVDTTWSDEDATLTIKVRHRGPVDLLVTPV